MLERLEREGCSRYVVTDVTKDGTLTGPNLELLGEVADRSGVPVIASGGAGKVEHFGQAIKAGADAVLAASVFHLREMTVGDVKDELKKEGVLVR